MLSLVGFFTFFSVLFLFLGYRSHRNYRMQSLRSSIDGNFTIENEEKERKPVSIPFYSTFFTEFKKAGFRAGNREFTLICVIVSILGYLILTFLISSSYGVLGIGVGLLAFRIWLRGRIKKRTILMRGQFSNALVRMANSMRSQVPLHETIRIVTEKVGEPLQSEFLRIYQYYQTERNMVKALKMVQDQIPLEEFKLFVTSYEIHQQVGGNFPDLMDKLSVTIGEKQEMDRKLQAHSIQGKQNARMIGMLPIVVFIAMRLIAPDLMEPMTQSPTGQFILFYCFCSIGFGWYIVNRMTDVTLD